MADVKQMDKMIPLITCEIALCQYVCEMVFGVDIIDLNLWIQIDSVKQPVKCLIVGFLPLMTILITASYFVCQFSFPLLFKSPQSRALDPRKTGCPLSLKLIIMISATSSHSPFDLYM